MFHKTVPTPLGDAFDRIVQTVTQTAALPRDNDTAETFEAIAKRHAARADNAECVADINSGTIAGYRSALDLVLQEISEGVAGKSTSLSSLANPERMLTLTRQARAYDFEGKIADPKARVSTTRSATVGLQNALALLDATLDEYYATIPAAHVKELKKKAREALAGKSSGMISDALTRAPMKREAVPADHAVARGRKSMR